MATVLDARGWDCGNMMLNAPDYSGEVAISSTHYTGAYSLRLDPLNVSWVRWTITGTPANPSCSVWLYLGTYDDSDKTRLQFLLGTGEYIGLRWDSANHTFDAYVDGAKVADGTVEVSTHGWFHVQFYAVIDDAGSIGVKINGHQSIDYSGDTQPGVATGATYLYVTTVLDLWARRYIYIDNLVIGSGGYLGDLRCVDIRPNADIAQDDWTPSAGDNYSTIDETPASDADYNETNTDAQADELAMGDFDGATYDPRATVAWVRAKMLAATGDSIKVGVDSNGTDDTTEHALSTDEEYYFHTNDDNPDDSAAWEDADIDALKLRYESVIA